MSQTLWESINGTDIFAPRPTNRLLIGLPGPPARIRSFHHALRKCRLQLPADTLQFAPIAFHGIGRQMFHDGIPNQLPANLGLRPPRAS
jgi:hypothetical protein